MWRKRTHTIRAEGRKIRHGRAARAGAAVAVIALAAIIATLALLPGGTSQPSRRSPGRERSALPALAMTSFAGYRGQVPLPGTPRLTVDAIADGGGQRLAAGSADGHPAVWRQDISGRW